MKSIQSKLILSLSAVIISVLLIGAFSIYRSVQASLYDEIDTDLASSLGLQVIEVEIIGTTQT